MSDQASITVNGDARPLPAAADGASAPVVADLLAELGLAGRPAAVEVNGDVVPKAEHAARPIAAGDRVEIVTLVGGG